MKWQENFDMEYGRCSEWNEMEDLKNVMEDRLPYLPNSELSLHILKLITNKYDTFTYTQEASRLSLQTTASGQSMMWPEIIAT